MSTATVGILKFSNFLLPDYPIPKIVLTWCLPNKISGSKKICDFLKNTKFCDCKHIVIALKKLNILNFQKWLWCLWSLWAKPFPVCNLVGNTNGFSTTVMHRSGMCVRLRLSINPQAINHILISRIPMTNHRYFSAYKHFQNELLCNDVDVGALGMLPVGAKHLWSKIKTGKILNSGSSSAWN